jgi:hypothetical protein
VLTIIKSDTSPGTDIHLQWTGGMPDFDIYRAIAKTDVGDPSFWFQSTSDAFFDTTETGSEVYFWVE